MQWYAMGHTKPRKRSQAAHYYEHHPKPASCESLAGAEDDTLGNTRTSGSNPKRVMLCCEMQSINSGTLGMQNQENDPKAAHYCGCHPKPASCESLAGAGDGTLSNTRTKGLNPKHTVSV